MYKSTLALSTLALVLVATLSGCNISINPVSTGPLRTAKIDVPQSSGTGVLWDVELDPGAAMVTVGVGGDSIVNGTIDYNVDEWKPIIAINGQSVRITQSNFTGIPPANSQNDWHLKLGQGVPLSLTVNAGAIKGEWELGGLRLRGLDWKQGAADTTIRFTQANPENLDSLNIEAGASSMKVLGLANVNAHSARINMGAGSLSLRFDGKLARDVEVTLEGGAAAVTIDSGGNPVQVLVGKSLTAVSSGDWSHDGDVYQSPEWAGATGPKVTVQANLGAASLSLVSGK